MLIKNTDLERIKRGEIKACYRRWKRAGVRAGGTLRTALGIMSIGRVETLTLKALTRDHAAEAGFKTKRALIESLAGRTGTLYRIEVTFREVIDEREVLRSKRALSKEDLGALKEAFAKSDALSDDGPWTRKVLKCLADNPEVRAQDLADRFGWEKKVFKRRVSRLKSLGLTISYSPGYRLSPRGEAALKALNPAHR